MCDGQPDQVPPAWAIALYTLQQTDGWQSRQNIHDHISDELGVAVSKSTLGDALQHLRDKNLVESRYRNINGSEAYEYRTQ